MYIPKYTYALDRMYKLNKIGKIHLSYDNYTILNNH